MVRANIAHTEPGGRPSRGAVPGAANPRARRDTRRATRGRAADFPARRQPRPITSGPPDPRQAPDRPAPRRLRGDVPEAGRRGSRRGGWSSETSANGGASLPPPAPHPIASSTLAADPTPRPRLRQPNPPPPTQPASRQPNPTPTRLRQPKPARASSANLARHPSAPSLDPLPPLIHCVSG